MPDSADAILSQLPAKLRAARRAQGLSLDAVSRLSGVSRSMVSQIERGESSPTIATLLNLTRALQVDFAGLLESDDGPARIEIVRQNDLPVIDRMGSACRIVILSPPEDVGAHEVYRLDFGDGGHLVSQPHQPGTREQILVLGGTVSVTAGEDTARIGPGDTVRYAADQAHAIRAEDGPAQAILIVRGG